MTAELSQPTLGLLRRILEGMEPAYAVALPDRKKFWKDQLFDFGFPPRVIEIAVSYEFRWGDIISDLFIGRFGPQNQHFADALPSYFCEQTLKRLLALALHEGTDSVLIEQLAESLKRERVEVTWTDKPIAQTTEAQTSSITWLSDTQREVLKTVVSRFLETNEPTSRILLVKKVVDPDIVDELTPVLLRNPTGEKLFPTALAFQCCGDKNALEAAKSAVQLVIRTLQKLFSSSGEKVHFSIDEIEEQARLILNTQRAELGSTGDRVVVQLGLYLIQDFRRVHAGMGGVYPSIAHVVVHERIGSINPATAWNEHIEQYSSYLKNRGEKTAVWSESVKSAENPVANAKPVASEGDKPMEPFKVLTEAVKAVPAVKNALGIAGVIAVIAIVKRFGIDYRTAVFGAVIMLVLMAMLVIFAKLAAKRESFFHWPVIIFTWFALILIMATAIALFSSVFWGRPLELRYKDQHSSATNNAAGSIVNNGGTLLYTQAECRIDNKDYGQWSEGESGEVIECRLRPGRYYVKGTASVGPIGMITVTPDWYATVKMELDDGSGGWRTGGEGKRPTGADDKDHGVIKFNGEGVATGHAPVRVKFTVVTIRLSRDKTEPLQINPLNFTIDSSSSAMEK